MGIAPIFQIERAYILKESAKYLPGFKLQPIGTNGEIFQS